MESLISRVPASFLRAIEADQEIVILFLKELWPHIVGEELARNTQPAQLRSKVLTVVVPTIVWVNQLASLSGMMIESINRFWGSRLIETIDWETGLSDRATYGEP
jgi:predicted nucleic acid-binding Zn ribbon protein